MAKTNDLRPRRWLQFRLRGLLAIMSIAALTLGWWSYRREQARSERRAVEQVQRLQEKLTEPHEHWIDGPLIVETRPAPWWLRIGGERLTHRVTAVSFDVRSYDDGFEEPSGITDDDLLILASLPHLHSLRAPRSRVSDAGLAWVKEVHELRTLDLAGSQVTDQGLEHLQGLESLESLVLDDLNLQGGGLARLATCRRLKELSLRGVQMDSEGAKALNRLPSLEKLTLNSSTLDRLHLSGLPRLRQLTLNLTADHMDLHFKGMPRLQDVTIQLSAATPPQKLWLTDLGALRTLRVHCDGKAPFPAADGEPLALRSLPSLQSVVISGTTLATTILPNVARLTSLQELLIYSDGASTDDATARLLAGLPNLRKLHLGRTLLTDNGLNELTAIRTLEELSFQSEAVTNAGLLHLSALPRLRFLHLGGVTEREDPGPVLARLPRLQELSLGGCRFTALTLQGDADGSGAPFRYLKSFSASNCPLKEIHVSGLPALADLSLAASQARQIHVAGLVQLRRLDISLASGQTVERFLLRGLPQLSWLSLQCGSTGARVPAHTFDHFGEFPRLRNGIVWGLDMPPEAHEKFKRWKQETGARL